MAVFKDPQDPSVPVIIYFPYVPNVKRSPFDPQTCLGSWCSTFKFLYPADKANMLINLSKSSMKDAAPDIINEIKQWTETH